MLDIAVAISAALSIVYLAITVYLFSGLRRLRPGGQPQGLTFSVVIAARNEEKNIENCLKHVFDQTLDHKRFEVILAADRCRDATAAIASRIAQQYPGRLTVIEITETPPGFSPKMYALSRAIAAVKNEIIALTDADCTVPRTWLESIDRNFTPSTALVQGITTYSADSSINAVLWGLQSLDFLSHCVVSAAAIGAGTPINANANNLAFRKSAFDAVGGYASMHHVVSGDDDLLVQRIVRLPGWSVRYMIDSSGAVTTLPTKTASGVFEQRKRWGSKTVHYGPIPLVMLAGVFIFYACIILTLAAGCFRPAFLRICAAMMAVKFAGEILLLMPGTRMFGQKRLRRFLLPASLVHLPVVLAAVVLGVFGRFTWKGTLFRRTSAG